MAKRILRTNRFDERIWKAIGKVAKARKISRSKLLELCFWQYQEAVGKMTDAEREAAEAEALRVLENIARDSKE